MSSSPNQEQIFDFLFIGLGAGNSHMLLALLKNKCLVGKKVAVIESDEKNSNDKTYCFWAHDTDDLVKDFKAIISYQYTQIELPKGTLQSIQHQPYCYIRSIDFYKHTLQICQQEQIPIFRTAVEAIQPKNEIYQVSTNTATALYAHTIFDSRPPQPQQLHKNDIFINQSFYGYHIKTEQAVFDTQVFEMMNFDVDQSGYTQFIYVLPFSSNEALVELTRFGKEKIDKDYARKTLDTHILKTYGTYEIIADEVGNIPMTTYQQASATHEGIIHTGARANLIKPSTGYGFKKMYLFAEAVSQKMAKQQLSGLHQFKLATKARFQLYDRLLLIILNLWPHQGKRIFSSLFKYQKIKTIFDFLDEKTQLHQEVKIFATLPLLPFLKALYLYIKQEHLLRYLSLIVLSIIYFCLKAIDVHTASIFSYTTIIVGLLFIGIPHGAVDHLLDTHKKTTLFLFILKYLCIVFAYFVAWHFFPTFSLLVFILFSAFHFGEAELKENNKKQNHSVLPISSFLLGLCILLSIIFSHYRASAQIISYISPGLNNYLFPVYGNWYAALIVLISCFYIIMSMYYKEGKLPTSLMLILFLGMLLPLELAFGFYFIFQHSYNAWQHLQIGLALPAKTLYKQAMPYTIGAILIGVVFYFFNATSILQLSHYSGLFFIFLACISLPHFVLMHLFYKQINNHF